MKSRLRIQDMFSIFLNALIVAVAYRAVFEGKEVAFQALIGVTVCTFMLTSIAHYSLSRSDSTSLRNGHPALPWVSSFFCALTANMLWQGSLWILTAVWGLFVVSDIFIAWRIIHLPPCEAQEDSEIY